MTLAWSLDLPDSQKIVLLALADCANDEGHCWPSMASLARKCSKGERTVQGVIKQLVDAGHVTREEVIGKGCNYWVHPRRDCAPQPSRPARTAPPQGTAQTPAAAADKPSRTVITKTQNARGTRLSSNWRPKPLPADLADAVAAWPAGAIERELARFRDWAASAPGAKGVKSDWDATWRNWLRRKIDESPTNDKRPANINRGASGADLAEAARRKLGYA